MGVDIKELDKAEEKKAEKKEEKREFGVGGLILLGIIIWALFPPKPPEELYECPYCDATFKTKAELDAHIEAIHPSEPTPDEGVVKPEVSILTLSWL